MKPELYNLKACNTTADCEGNETAAAIERAADDIYVCDTTISRCVVAGNVTCGDTFCPKGQICCNPSCGICIPPEGGWSCTEQYCGPVEDDMLNGDMIDSSEEQDNLDATAEENRSVTTSAAANLRTFGCAIGFVASMMLL